MLTVTDSRKTNRTWVRDQNSEDLNVYFYSKNGNQ